MGGAFVGDEMYSLLRAEFPEGESLLQQLDEPWAWYRERREPEQSWRGVLRKRQPEEGPASRSSLLFELHAFSPVHFVELLSM